MNIERYAEETAEITQAYLKLSESTGQAVTDNVQAQKFLVKIYKK